MTKEQRNLVAEQQATVTKVFMENDIDLKDVEAGLTLYKSIIRAKERAGKRKGYEDIQYLLDAEPRKALIQLIQGKPDFWESWKAQQVKYKASGFNEDSRPSLHRIDAKGHYEIGNIAMLPYGEHLQENAVTTGFFGTKDGKTYFELFRSITEASNFFGISPNVLKNIENQAVDINGYIGMYARIEQQQSTKTKEEQQQIDKAAYTSLVNDIKRFETMQADKVDQGLLQAMHRDKILYERFGWDKL